MRIEKNYRLMSPFLTEEEGWQLFKSSRSVGLWLLDAITSESAGTRWWPKRKSAPEGKAVGLRGPALLRR